MTWQEELRKLDESLASGSLSADEYRTRRDQILSSAVTSPDPQQQPQSQASADSTQVIEPLSPSSAPQQPAAGQAGPADDPGAERTQVVSNWQAQPPHPQAQASPPAGFPQPQQLPPASPPGGFAGPQQPQPPYGQPWNAPQSDTSPPWGGADLPPVAPPSPADWGMSQGPESFDDAPAESRSGRKVLFSILGVVLVAGIGFAVWALFINNGGGSTQADQPPATSQSAPPPQPTTQPLPEPPAAKAAPEDNDAAIIDPPGTERNGGGPFDLDQLRQNQMLPEPVIEALADANMTEGLLKTTRDGENTIGVYAIEVEDENAAIAVADEYAVTQQEGGIPAVRDHAMQGVRVLGAGSPTSDSVYRAVYVLYTRVIIIDITGPSQDAIESQFAELLDEQVNLAPPTHRES
ncbi:flagellar basal body protein FliL [Saccharomonospora sp. NPDC046836]|uniref:SHOCT domain-containing protein n=1 Tax=Saccharomonospora sp. NPDC046836 TaxID=3156921 RepID=UPI003401C903